MTKQLDTTGADNRKPVMMTTATLAKSFGMKTTELNVKLLQKGLLRKDVDVIALTRAGRAAGGESRYSNKYGMYFLWPSDFTI